MKTPGSKKASDTPLPLYPHEIDLAAARDVAVLWRAVDTRTPEHASFTEDNVRLACRPALPSPSHSCTAAAAAL